MSPFSSRRPCPGKGPRKSNCPNVISKGIAYCQDCIPYAKKEEAKYNRERDQTDERHFIHSPQWRAIRAAKLAKDPLCERCISKGDDVAAVMVHHKDGNELNNLDENLESLCNPCHEGIEKDNRYGRKNIK